MKTLRTLFDEHKTDKGSKHSYDLIYEPLFQDKRLDQINFLEIGIWKGHGLAALHDYFENGNLYGIDIFTRIKPEDVPILREYRVDYIKGDSTKSEIMGVLNERFDVKFDYILDDGLHTPEANKLTFRHMHPFLKSGGLYIIEDVWPLEKMSSKELKHPWLHKHPLEYSQEQNKAFLAEIESSGWEIARYDNRKKSGEPDSYVITLKKP